MCETHYQLTILEQVHTNECDLEFANTIAYGDEFACAPHETFHLEGAHGFFQRFHIGLIVPRFDLEGDDRLGELNEREQDRSTDLGDRLGLVRFLSGIRGDTLSLYPFGLLVHFVVRAKEVDVIVFLGHNSSWRRGRSGQCLGGLGRSGESVEFVRVGLYVLVPTCGVGSCGSVRDTRERPEDVRISLRRHVPDANSA